MNKCKSTMQSEQLEDSVSCRKATKSPCEMTFTNNTETLPSTIMKHEPINKLDDINLDDDIEKVEVSSTDSTNSSSTTATPTAEEAFTAIPEQNQNESIKSWLQRITDIHNDVQKKRNIVHSTTTASSSGTRIVKYQDLPYMGEMTLDNSKPRRGRKPKKADICHLIYKNYGTIFPGTPNPNSYLEGDNNNGATKHNKSEPNETLHKSDIQNRISSLLERRLTQEYKRSKELEQNNANNNQSEPLNLCIRDLNHLKIRLLKNTDNTYTPEIKSEPQSDDDDAMEVVPCVKQEQQSGSPLSDSLSASSREIVTKTPPDQGGYVYWPNAGVFIHPMALQQQLMMYQRMTNTSSCPLPNHSPRPPPAEKRTDMELRKLVPKENVQQLENKPKRNASTPVEKTPPKRKRSAIFIPPIPPENNSNPATEVSICKFKFTGGAKPSLQEKKMLSVDSGGNFRYYSGTGDKSMRGYEFFPRETLQQQINSTQGSSTGAFLQASGEKIYPDGGGGGVAVGGGGGGVKPGPEFLLTTDLPTSNLRSIDETNARHKKRKSRKSLQREKLEQTFKEKGFLIQTQQLESAEGATYCKFRQLRKFTRYLFRSWKDYLPGNVREMQENEVVENNRLNVNDADNVDSLSSVNSSELSSNNVQ